MASWLMVLLIVIPWLGALIAMLTKDEQEKLQHGIAVLFSLLAAGCAIILLFNSSAQAKVQLPIGGAFGVFTLVPDGLGVFLAAVAAIVGSLAVIFSVDYMQGEKQLGRYYALILFFIGAMAGLGLSGSMLFMFFFWEITAFCSYALISFYNDDPKAVAGGVKALIVTQLGGVGLLAGALLIHSAVGDYQIETFLIQAGNLPPNLLAIIAFGFLAAAAAKSAQIPFQTWLPDAMEAPTPVTALIHAATMVNAGVYLLARFYPAFHTVPGWSTSVVIVGMLSALLAAVMAMVANDLKRALAYSTISQLGYMVYAIGVGSIFASQLHLMSHAVFKALLFLSAGAVIHTLGTRDMRSMGGLGKQMPFVRVVFLAGSLGLSGLPIANGFFSKELILEGGAAHGPTWAYIGMLLGAGLTAFYTLRMIKMVFYGEPGTAQAEHDAPPAMRTSMGILALGALTTWLLAGTFSHFLSDILPHHSLHTTSTWHMVLEICTAPATPLALAVIAAGLGFYQFRTQLEGINKRLGCMIQFAQSGLGFEWMNEEIIHGTNGLASFMRRTQTGQLNWNILGIVLGLGVLLLVVVVGS